PALPRSDAQLSVLSAAAGLGGPAVSRLAALVWRGPGPGDGAVPGLDPPGAGPELQHHDPRACRPHAGDLGAGPLGAAPDVHPLRRAVRRLLPADRELVPGPGAPAVGGGGHGLADAARGGGVARPLRQRL